MKPLAKMERTQLLLCIGICAIVAAAFSPSLANGFTNYDDNAYLTDNPLVRSLAPANITRIFTTTRPHTVFAPLVTLAFALEYSLWGLDPLGFHVVNLLLHVANALLAFLLIRRISRAPLIAFFTSLLFALHPLRVESVAWITERKDLLFTFFFLLALLAYGRYLRAESRRHYLAALLLFAAAILAKMSALVLPLALLLMDWQFEKKISKKRWLEKLPFAVILLLYGISSWSSLQAFSISNPRPNAADQQAAMLQNSLYVVPFYVQKTIYPSRLSAQYPTDMRFFMPPLWLAILLVTALIAATFLLLRSAWREWLWGWGFFLLALLPTFGVVWHFFPVANRYSYLPAIGLSYVLVMAVSRAAKKLGRGKPGNMLAIALAILALVLLGSITFNRCRVWHDSLSLWNDVIRKYPMIPLAYHNRAAALKAAGRLSEAQADYSRAIELLPHGSFFWNRGLLKLQTNQGQEADADFLEAVLYDPEYFRRYGLMIIDRNGPAGYERIVAMGRRALAARPDPRIHVKMAEALIRLRRWPQAEFHLQEAARLAPGQEEYRLALQAFRQALRGRGRRSE